jgi:hypothetical protein
MAMGNDVARGNPVTIRELRGETGGAIDGGRLLGCAPEFADLNTNASPVAAPAVVGMITLLRREEMLHSFAIIHGVMPRNPAGATEAGIVLTADAFAGEELRVLGSGAATVGGGVDRDVPRPHRSPGQTAVHAGRQERGTDIGSAAGPCRSCCAAGDQEESRHGTRGNEQAKQSGGHAAKTMVRQHGLHQ